MCIDNFVHPSLANFIHTVDKRKDNHIETPIENPLDYGPTILYELCYAITSVYSSQESLKRVFDNSSRYDSTEISETFINEYRKIKETF
jgi:hypothetical protein